MPTKMQGKCLDKNKNLKNKNKHRNRNVIDNFN